MTSVNGISADVILAMPEVALLAAVTVVLLIGVFTGRAGETVTYWLCLVTLAGVFLLVHFAPYQSESFAFGGMYIDDKLAEAVKSFVCITVAVVFIYARPYLMQQHTCRQPEFYVLGLLATLGVLVMASAHNFILIYLGLELLSLSLYALVAYVRDSNDTSEAAMKYFVLGAIASGMLLYGMSILYGLSGTLDLAELNLYVSNQSNQDGINIPLTFALTFIVAGVAFKFGAVPFHMWLPDVYHGSSTVITLFIATAPKLAAFVMALRLLSDGLQGLFGDWWGMLMILAALSLIFGNVIAIAQTNIKRMLAYSTISHIGFVLLGLLSGNDFGYAAAFFYTVIYVLMAAGAFGTLSLINNQNKDVSALVDLKGLSKTSPWFALIMLLIMFSMAGVPLTVGFYAKLYILQSLIDGGMLWLAILAIVMSVVGAFYYLRVVKFMYFDEAGEELCVRSSILARSVLSTNGLSVVILFIFPNALLDYCIRAVN